MEPTKPKAETTPPEGPTPQAVEQQRVLQAIAAKMRAAFVMGGAVGCLLGGLLTLILGVPLATWLLWLAGRLR